MGVKEGCKRERGVGVVRWEHEDEEVEGGGEGISKGWVV